MAVSNNISQQFTSLESKSTYSYDAQVETESGDFTILNVVGDEEPEDDEVDDEQQTHNRKLWKAMAGLKPELRNCMELLTEGAEYKEIAVRLNLPMYSVKNYIKRARILLQAALGNKS
nr:sigma factor-like helix-turn-helix DNA-binding protein [Hymenobacter siberiensis]